MQFVIFVLQYLLTHFQPRGLDKVKNRFLFFSGDRIFKNHARDNKFNIVLTCYRVGLYPGDVVYYCKKIIYHPTQHILFKIDECQTLIFGVIVLCVFTSISAQFPDFSDMSMSFVTLDAWKLRPYLSHKNFTTKNFAFSTDEYIILIIFS